MVNEQEIVQAITHPLSVEQERELIDKLEYEDEITPDRLRELIDSISDQQRLDLSGR